MSQSSGRMDPAEAKTGGQTPEAVPAPEPEKAEKTPEQRQAARKDAPSRKAPPKKAPPKKRPPKSTGRLLAGLLIKVAVAAALVWAVFTFVLGLSVHYGNNMHPAVRDGDLVVSYRMQKPFINAVVLYRIVIFPPAERGASALSPGRP